MQLLLHLTKDFHNNTDISEEYSELKVIRSKKHTERKEEHFAKEQLDSQMAQNFAEEQEQAEQEDFAKQFGDSTDFSSTEMENEFENSFDDKVNPLLNKFSE